MWDAFHAGTQRGISVFHLTVGFPTTMYQKTMSIPLDFAKSFLSSPYHHAGNPDHWLWNWTLELPNVCYLGFVYGLSRRLWASVVLQYTTNHRFTNSTLLPMHQPHDWYHQSIQPYDDRYHRSIRPIWPINLMDTTNRFNCTTTDITDQFTVHHTTDTTNQFTVNRTTDTTNQSTVNRMTDIIDPSTVNRTARTTNRFNRYHCTINTTIPHDRWWYGSS